MTSLDAFRLLQPTRPDPDARIHVAQLLEALNGFTTPVRGRPRKETPKPMPRPNGRCRACGRDVLVAVTMAGRLQPLDPQPDDTGNVAVYRDATGTWRARVPSEILPAHPWEKIHMPHHATCAPPAKPDTPLLPDGVASLAEHRNRKKTRDR